MGDARWGEKIEERTANLHKVGVNTVSAAETCETRAFLLSILPVGEQTGGMEFVGP